MFVPANSDLLAQSTDGGIVTMSTRNSLHSPVVVPPGNEWLDTDYNRESMAELNSSRTPTPGAGFPATRWSLVDMAAGSGGEAPGEADAGSLEFASSSSAQSTATMDGVEPLHSPIRSGGGLGSCLALARHDQQVAREGCDPARGTAPYLFMRALIKSR